MAEPYKEGASYSMRLRQDGHDVYVSGHKSKRQARVAAQARLAEVLRGGRPKGRGASRTSLDRRCRTTLLSGFRL